MPNILVVEDDPVSRAIVCRALGRISGHVVVGATCLAEARLILEELTPQLVVLDLHLPDGSGFDVLALLRRREIHPSVILVSAHSHDLTPPTHPSPVRIFSKPLDIEAFLDASRGCLTPLDTATVFSVAEYVQLAALGRRSVTLSCKSEWGMGQVQLFEGEIWSAKVGQKTGFAAFSLLVRAGGIVIELAPLMSHETHREMVGNWQELLFEAARLEDEENSRQCVPLTESELDFSDLLSEPVQSIAAPPSSRSSPSNRDAQLVVQQGIRAVVTRRYEDAVRHFEEALRLEPNSTPLKHRLSRLYEMGFGRMPDSKEQAG